MRAEKLSDFDIGEQKGGRKVDLVVEVATEEEDGMVKVVEKES